MSDEVPPPVTPETPYTPPQANPTPPVPTGSMPPEQEKNWVLALHLSQLAMLTSIPFAGLIAPLVIWLMKKDQSPAIDAHGKEVVNFQITISIAAAVFFILAFIGIGILLLFALVIAAVVFIILATIKVSNGEFYRYPLTIRFIK